MTEREIIREYAKMHGLEKLPPKSITELSGYKFYKLNLAWKEFKEEFKKHWPWNWINKKFK